MKKVNLLIFLFIVFIFASCDFLFQSIFDDDQNSEEFIHQNSDKSIVVISANPKPEDISSDGFTFTVSIDLPTNHYGYCVWIYPASYYPSSAGFWYKASEILPPKSSNIIRGGWLFENSDIKEIVNTWFIQVSRRNSDGSMESIYKAEFSYRVEGE